MSLQRGSSELFVVHDTDDEPVRFQIVAAVVKYLRGAAAQRQPTLTVLDSLIGAALDGGIDAVEIASLITVTINHSRKRRSPQAEVLRQRYLRRESKFWAGAFGAET